MKRKLIFAGLLILASSSARGQAKTGTSIGQFLLIEPSARIAAMGNAGSTTYGEIEAAYYNPAAIGLFPASGIQFTHSRWLADISYDYAGVGVTLGEFGNLYGTITSLNSGEIDVRTVDQPLGTGERYTASDIAFGVGYGRKISDKFSVGVQISYLQETIWHSSMSAFAMNVGTLYRISEDGLHIGASISNFGTRARYDGYDLRIFYDQNAAAHGDNAGLPANLQTDDFPLPILFRVGIGVPVTVNDDNKIRFALDAFHPSDNNESVSLGGEWTYIGMFSVRAGYQNLFLKDSETGLTLGAGISHEISSTMVSFDYGWAGQGRLEGTHRLTLGISF